ncbi:hypothetical protein BV898_17421 [Hypsibius exemplaris]|uniref:G-protein coupled receptors family 1 profile domain-containing protein n=1 Tax=Hypsibius exemplaris TaxID=2072580 RepID=A0A9X6RM09_HYPEX|nr:hypothetical protein BV898_17421 [Hypsibius exemplaris]
MDQQNLSLTLRKNATTNCTVSTAEWSAMQVPPIVQGSLIISAQLLNLLFFAQWSNKEPYVLYHISLAASSLLAGATIAASVVLRYQPLTTLTLYLVRLLVMGLYFYANCSALIGTLFISVDRWISVEFPVRYRSAISRRKVLWVICGPIWLSSLVIVASGVARYWTNMVVLPCSGQKIFTVSGPAFAVWEYAKGPFVLPLLFLTQLR